MQASCCYFTCADFKYNSMYSAACYYVNVHGEYMRERVSIMKMLSVSTSKKIVLKRLKKKPARPRRFWVRPGRTSAGGTFFSQTVVPEEWREDFRMSRESMNSKAEELRPYIEGIGDYEPQAL